MCARALMSFAIALVMTAATDPRQSPDQDIRAAVSRCVQSWDESDAAGIADAYERNGDFVSPDGIHAVGRKAIEAFYSGAFAKGYAHSQGEFAVRSIRFVAPNLAIVDGVWGIKNARDPNGHARPPERGLAVAILRKRTNSWKIVALREQTSATELHPM